MLRGGVQLRPGSGLVDRALALLAQGPVSTGRLAEQVLALRGNPRAAAAAVFTLLGSDGRVQVDGDGIWSLAIRQGEFFPSPLSAEEWVVVDVETTGGSPARGHRIIEVAAVRVARGRIAGHFTTLINPRRSVPGVVTSLTGITREAVAAAPVFHEVVPALSEALSGRVFVGHNAGFDWRFVCAEMERCTGQTLTGRQLCTLRLARRMLPHLPSRSLGALADYFGVEMIVHHRALDDAAATAELLIRFLATLEDEGISDWPALELFLKRRPRRRRRRARPRSMDAA